MKLFTFISAGVFLVWAGWMVKKEPKAPTSLYQTKWTLCKIQTGTGMTEVNTRAFIRFDEEKKSAGGNGSCNSFGSTAVVSGNALSITNIFSTKMFCESVQGTENNLFSQLAAANRFEIVHNRLSLYNDNELLLEFTAER